MFGGFFWGGLSFFGRCGGRRISEFFSDRTFKLLTCYWIGNVSERYEMEDGGLFYDVKEKDLPEREDG
jgi:hypothetical protein